MIEHKIKRHDRYQLELKSVYPADPGARHSESTVDLYLFVPAALDIHAGSYKSEYFFQDLKTNIRMKTPVCRLADLTSDCPYVKALQDATERVSIDHGKDAEAGFEHQLKLFCSVFNRALLVETEEIEKRTGGMLVRGLQQYCEQVRHGLHWFRHAIRHMSSKGVDTRLGIAASSADEYLSLQTERHSLRLLRSLEAAGYAVPEELTPLMNLCAEESAYRDQMGMNIAIDENDKEAFTHRRSLLKKYFSSALFLQANRRNGGVLLEQSLMGFAAGLAMLFATAAAFYFQRRFGNLTMPFLVGLVTSYIFKDRIKELTRMYMIRKARRFIHDRRIRLLDQRGQRMGEVLESVFFVKDEQLPEEVQRVRDRKHTTRIARLFREEDVLQYRKKVRILGKRIAGFYSGGSSAGVTEIMRFNVARFLTKMDDPEKSFLMLRNGRIERTTGRRIYKVNLVLSLSCRDQNELFRYRLILDRRGIRRIEPVQYSGLPDETNTE